MSGCCGARGWSRRGEWTKRGDARGSAQKHPSSPPSISSLTQLAVNTGAHKETQGAMTLALCSIRRSSSSSSPPLFLHTQAPAIKPLTPIDPRMSLPPMLLLASTVVRPGKYTAASKAHPPIPSKRSLRAKLLLLLLLPCDRRRPPLLLLTRGMVLCGVKGGA